MSIAQASMDTPFWQANSFWGGIVVTAILSVPIGILANFSYYKLVSYLDSRKIISQRKNKKRALALDAVVSDLRAGRRDRYAYMLRTTMAIIVAFILSISSISAGTVILALVPIEPRFEIHQLRVLFLLISLFGTSVFGVVLAASATERFRSITNALEKYDDYRTDFQKKWGE